MQALARLDAALLRLENLPLPSPNADGARLREEAAAALRSIDTLITELEGGRHG